MLEATCALADDAVAATIMNNEAREAKSVLAFVMAIPFFFGDSSWCMNVRIVSWFADSILPLYLSYFNRTSLFTATKSPERRR
jgi:hypothetical protein